MSGKYLRLIPVDHDCKPRRPRKAGDGSLWECEHGIVWRYHYSPYTDRSEWREVPLVVGAHDARQVKRAGTRS